MVTITAKIKHLIYIAFAFSFLMGACACQSSSKTDDDMLQNSNPGFLALGDSYTIGEGVAVSERWPVIFADTIREMGFEVDSPLIIARTGWTTKELMNGIEQANPQGPFGMVSLLIGVNNQYRGVSRGFTLELYRQEFEELLEIAVSFAGGKPGQVIVLSIPDYGVTPFVAASDKKRVSAEIDAYNAVNREIAIRTGAHYIDITPVSREAAQDPEWLVSDNLHPSGKMYKAWVELILRGIKPEH